MIIRRFLLLPKECLLRKIDIRQNVEFLLIKKVLMKNNLRCPLQKYNSLRTSIIKKIIVKNRNFDEMEKSGMVILTEVDDRNY